MMKASSSPSSTTTSDIRSKLWSTGYKLSSNRVDEFLHYLMDKNNNIILAQDSDSDSDSDEQVEIKIETEEPQNRTRTTTIKECHTRREEDLEHLVATMEQEVQRLEATVREFCTEPSWRDDAHLLSEPESILEEPSQEEQSISGTRRHDPDERKKQNQQQNQQQKQQQQKKKKKKTSDPVHMFHRMQALWSKNNTNRHCP